MARRWFTSDWHLGMQAILHFENRPFKTIEAHDSALLRSACQRATVDDTIIHIGDLFCYKQNSHSKQYGLPINGSNKWKHCLDLDNSVLNINCGVDVWNYKIVSEDEIIKYIESILRLPKEKIFKVKYIDEKLYFS